MKKVVINQVIQDITTGEEYVSIQNNIAPEMVIVVEPSFSSCSTGSELDVTKIREDFEDSLQQLITFFEAKGEE